MLDQTERTLNAVRGLRFRTIAGATLATIAALAAVPAAATEAKADAGFKSLFMSWKRMDAPSADALAAPSHAIAVPSIKPTTIDSFSSGFGVRIDPFNHAASLHPGVDMPGPVGTPIYATADGVVDYARWMNGYGNLVELDHGEGLETRYGHLSKILVADGQHVRKGDLIALMGSTGRSTGSHLHYEVRLAGHAINPMPYLENIDYADATRKGLPIEQLAKSHSTAMGGPAE